MVEGVRTIICLSLYGSISTPEFKCALGAKEARYGFYSLALIIQRRYTVRAAYRCARSEKLKTFHEFILCKTKTSQFIYFPTGRCYPLKLVHKKHPHLKQVNYKNDFASLHLRVADRDGFMPDICLPEFFDSTLCCSSQFNHAHLCTAVIHTLQQCKSKQLIVLIARTLCCH